MYLAVPLLQYPQPHLCSPGTELEELFHEYEAGETPEARLVKDFDKARSLMAQQSRGSALCFLQHCASSCSRACAGADAYAAAEHKTFAALALALRCFCDSQGRRSPPCKPQCCLGCRAGGDGAAGGRV